MKLFLDDIRNPSDCISYMYGRIGQLNSIYLEKWEVVRSFEEFYKFVTQNYNNISHVSFDHDLSYEHYDPSMFEDDDYRYEEMSDKFKEKTGYYCAKWMVDFYKIKDQPLPKFIFVHSMNPIGRKKIENLFYDL